MTFPYSIGTVGGVNVDFSHASCSAHPSGISISGEGFTYGESFESDPYGIVNWVNGDSLNCEWTGLLSTEWNNSGNWVNCNNGRNNYPDSNDRVTIPNTATQPIINTAKYIYGIGAGVGGGTITVNAGAVLYVVNGNNTVQSNIKLQGDSAGCSTCRVAFSGDLTINNNATLTLGSGIDVSLAAWTKHIFVGDGVESGHLVAAPGSLIESEWPRLRSAWGSWKDYWGGITIGGNLVTSSSIDIDGLRIINLTNKSSIAFNFTSYYEIINLDNITISVDRHNGTLTRYFNFDTCTGGVFSDNVYDNINFVSWGAHLSSYNVNITSATCSAIGSLSFTNDIGLGSGSGYENDPYGVIDWP